MEEQIRQYLLALERADFTRIIQLFADQAMVISPLYGPQPAKTFYRQLFADTTHSQLTLLDLFENPTKRTAAVNFLYQWTLDNGELATFDCVDLFEFDGADKIKKLKIIYDTVHTRPAFERQKNQN